MRTDTSAQPLPQEATAFTGPYPPSWLDRLIRWIEALPGPPWLFYLALLLGQLVAVNAAYWLDGTLPFGQIAPFQSAQIVYGVYFLALLSYLKRVARSALAAFQPALGVGEREYRQLEYELTVLPARATLVATGIGVLLMAGAIVGDPLFGSIGTAGGLVYFVLTYWSVPLLPLLLYQILRQLRLVSYIHKIAAKIDLFQPTPLYAFSGLTVRVAVGFLAGLYFSALTDPSTFTNPVWFGTIGISAVLATAFFVLPLYGMHQRIRAEQQDLLAEANQRLHVLIAELHQGIDRREFADADALNKTLSSLLLERQVLEKISTWPWQPDTLRGFLTALLLPIVLWLITSVLERLLGF